MKDIELRNDILRMECLLLLADGLKSSDCIFEDEMQDIIKIYTYVYSGEEI